MKKIAALYTCFNRKEKTLKSLETLFKATSETSLIKQLDIYLTDDGSTDGTSEAVKARYPEVSILKGNGKLFWAEGMRNSWKSALEGTYDGYLLLNDDVEIYENMFPELLGTHRYSISNFNQHGIYIGSTEDKETKKMTYSGSVILNKFLYTQKRLVPNGSYQKCDLANANIMLVPNQVVNKIGILTQGYSHGMADYDYTLMASRKGIPVIVAPHYCGHCTNDHYDLYEGFSKKSLSERKRILNNPTGLAHKSYLKYMKKFFPFRFPLVVMFGWIKLYFPKIYLRYFRNR